METKHLEAAVAVARHGSFTQAASELYMSQSTISRQVAALERQIGSELFVRGLRSVSLTPTGRSFLPEAERILEAVTRAVAAAKAAAQVSRVARADATRATNGRDHASGVASSSRRGCSPSSVLGPDPHRSRREGLGQRNE